MAVSLLAHQIADLCLGKPPLRSLSAVCATVGNALVALKASEDNYISVWSCDHSLGFDVDDSCRCIGKICMVDIICYLCKEDNISSPYSALNSPVSVLLHKVPGLVRHVEPSSSLIEAIDLILQGAQNLVVPIKSNIKSYSKRSQLQKSKTAPTAHNGHEFCWLTPEDVIRFLLSSIGLFSPIPAFSIETLGIIRTEKFLAIGYNSPASSAVEAISSSLADQTSVAVVDKDGTLIGEISPFTLACCDETVAAAITTLSAGDLMAYIDCGGPPEDLVRIVEKRLKERSLARMLEEFTISSSSSNIPFNSSSSSSSSDDEEEALHSPLTPASKSGRFSRSNTYSARMVRRAEAIVCHPWSSLVAVMVQAIAHRVNYVWVIEEDYTVAGMVTFSDILQVLREHLQ